MKNIEWNGCYDESWKGLITDEAFAHPAKFAPGLIKRILAHGLERGYWKRGDLIGDPFGGICGGGIMAGYAGLNWIGVELEPRFVAMGQANIQLHAPTWCACGDASFVSLVQGDSRRFAQIVGEAAGVLTSPPYGGNANGDTTQDAREARRGFKQGKGGFRASEAYGNTPGQIGKLPPGELEGVISSPPYADGLGHGGGKPQHPMYAEKGLMGPAVDQYGTANGQINNLPVGTVDGAITSPPYAGCRDDGCGIAIDGETTSNKPGRSSLAGVISSPPYAANMKPTGLGTGKASRGQGDSAGRNKGDYHHPESLGQIGNLKEGTLSGAVTSPPYEDSLHPNESAEKQRTRMTPETLAKFGKNSASGNGGYGEVEGQIGNEKAETYWQAMHAVYAQCLIALKPGGYMAVVIKDYVKDKKIVPLCDQTLQLLTALGFEPVERVRAMLVKHSTREGLFHTETKTTERKSFFRRLAEKKGSPRIDWEEVIFVRKPL